MTCADDIAHKPHRFRYGIRSLLVAVALLAVLFAAYGWFHRTIVEPTRYSNAIEMHLETLAARRPKEMSPRQWDIAVGWTRNLHGNSLIRFQVDGPTIYEFEQRLAQKLAGDVNMDTIHWIWDEYAKVCPGGAKYQKFRSEMTNAIEGNGPN